VCWYVILIKINCVGLILKGIMLTGFFYLRKSLGFQLVFYSGLGMTFKGASPEVCVCWLRHFRMRCL